ncbi:MAG: LacI family DNA-binding transcriptional regulator [Prevotellaceae bacterium]|jgi:LacI family transcriptional regulator|nr:LacI family DNA-binding transcriptional regulator [Prevotellaceae bacterium]
MAIKRSKFPGDKVRIKDIARVAKVSVGTVDRVIHNRGGVSLDNQQRIEKILSRMDFKPNKMAQLLAIKNDYKLAVLLPESTYGEYWLDVIKGIGRAEEEVVDFRVRVEILQFNQYDIASFSKAAQELQKLNPDGVLMAPFFKREVLKLTRVLEDRNIPFVFIDSNVDGINSLAYYGPRSYQSGYVAAKMMMSNLEKSSTILLVGNAVGSNQTAKREEGFLAYLEKYSLEADYKILRVDLHADDDSRNEAQLAELFRKNHNIRGIIMFNSRIHCVADFLEKHKLKNIRAIGYDLLDRNVRFLKNGVVECIIAQRPQLQGYYGLMALAKYLAFNETVTAPVCYMPIDILLKENIDDYKVYPFDVD